MPVDTVVILNNTNTLYTQTKVLGPMPVDTVVILNNTDTLYTQTIFFVWEDRQRKWLVTIKVLV